jgi:pyrroline-5-carboxylate reductase
MKICFIGGGNMATAMIGGLLKQGSFKSENLSVVEPDTDACQHLKDRFDIQASGNLAQGIVNSRTIILSVKPQQLYDLCEQLSPRLTGQLIISIAAGIRASDLARWLKTTNIVRCMPNTPALIQCGVTGLYALPQVSEAECAIAGDILGSVGSTLWVEQEHMLDAVTAISGSGPAYVFYFMEALQLAAQKLGFDEETAKMLSIETFLGSVKLAQSSSEPIGRLRARVTSKNGTTERALLSLAANQVNQHIIEAALAAAVRSCEMGEELGRAL